MEIIKWNVIDIYFNDNEEKEVQKKIKQLEKIGYDEPQFDESGNCNYDTCVQLIKIFPKKIKQDAR